MYFGTNWEAQSDPVLSSPCAPRAGPWWTFQPTRSVTITSKSALTSCPQKLYFSLSMDSALHQRTECIGSTSYKWKYKQGLKSGLALGLCRSSLLELVPSSVCRGNVQFWPLWALSSLLISTIIFLQNVLMFQGQSKGKEASPHLARNSEPQLLGSISLAILIGGGLGHYKPSHHKVVK